MKNIADGPQQDCFSLLSSTPCFITGSGRSGLTVNAPVEDMRTAKPVSDLTKSIQSSTDDIDKFDTDVLDDDENDRNDSFGVENNTETLAVEDLYDKEEALLRHECSIQIYWSENDAYCAGTVMESDDKSKALMLYVNDDGASGLHMKNEVWKFETAAVNSGLKGTKFTSLPKKVYL